MCDLSSILGDVGTFIGDTASSVGSAVTSGFNSLTDALGLGSGASADANPSVVPGGPGDIAGGGGGFTGSTPAPPGLDFGGGFDPGLASVIGAAGGAGSPIPGGGGVVQAGANPSPMISPPSAPAMSVGATGGSAAGATDPTGTGQVAPPNPNAPNTPSNQGIVGNTLSFLKKNAGWLLPTVGLGATLLKGQQKIPYANQIKSIAQQEAKLGRSLADSINTGRLPPGAQAYLDQYAQGAMASIQSQYASMGLGNSSMLQSALANVNQQVASMKFNMSLQLTTAGLSALNMASSGLSALSQALVQQDDGLMQALSNFAGAMSLASAVGGKSPNA